MRGCVRGSVRGCVKVYVRGLCERVCARVCASRCARVCQRVCERVCERILGLRGFDPGNVVPSILWQIIQPHRYFNITGKTYLCGNFPYRE